jgi:hypothetical protein
MIKIRLGICQFKGIIFNINDWALAQSTQNLNANNFSQNILHLKPF